jgi:hypothetical protein
MRKLPLQKLAARKPENVTQKDGHAFSTRSLQKTAGRQQENFVPKRLAKTISRRTSKEAQPGSLHSLKHKQCRLRAKPN